MTMLDCIIISVYLLFCLSGFVAVVKFFTMPHWNSYAKEYYDGLDVSWCDLFWIALLSLIPLANVSMNAFWLWILRQQFKRRPLIKWPKFTLPKCKLPKCPIAIRGKKR